MSDASLARGWTTAVCVASGPSLTDSQCEIADEGRRAGRCRIIVVNDNWRKLPDADVLYACDPGWWELYADDVRERFHGEAWTHAPIADASGTYAQSESRQLRVIARYPWLECVQVTRAEGLPIGGRVCMGGNSGYQAIGLAYLFGARRIILIGYDLQRQDGANQGKAHWFGDHPKPLTQGAPTSWIRRFEVLAEDAWGRCEIINCTRTTALACFPRAELCDVLEEMHV